MKQNVIEKDKAKKLSKPWKIAVFAIICVVVIGGLTLLALVDENQIKPSSSVMYKDTFDSKLEVSVDGSMVSAIPSQFKAKFGDYTASVGMKLDDAGVYTTFNEQDTFLVTYVVDGVQYDIIMSNRAQDLGTFTAEDIMEICSDKDSEVLTYKDYDEDSKVCKSESVISLYRLAYAYVCESAKISDDLEGFDSESYLVKMDTATFAEELKKVTLFEKNDTDNIELNISGLGEVRLNDLSFINEPGYNYSASYGMLDIVDCDDYHTALFITGMENTYLSNIYLKMIPVEGYNNVYMDCEYYKSDAFGYRCFSVMTENGMYYFKIGEYEEDADAIMAEVIEWLGISKDDEKIETPVELVLDESDFIYDDDDYKESITSGTSETTGTDTETIEETEAQVANPSDATVTDSNPEN